MKKLTVVLAVAMVMMAVGSAVAAPINPVNDRPITINSAPAGEVDLSVILIPYGSPSQSNAGMWGISTPGWVTSPYLVVEYAGQAAANQFGIWFATNDQNILQIPIFNGPAGSGATATLYWNPADYNLFRVISVSGDVAEGSYDNDIINPFAFGFYLQYGNDYFYTADQLNGDIAMAVAFQSPTYTDTWVLGFEDQYGGDRDFNDMVVKIESLKTVPEPMTLILLGSGLLGLAAIRRKK